MLPEGIRVMDKDGKEEKLMADAVIFTVGMAPNIKTVEALRNCAPEFYTVGDCIKPGRIVQATQTGFFSAMNIR